MKRWALLLILPVLVIAPWIAALRFLWSIVFSPERATRIAIGYDQLVNVAANGSEDETISSRANRERAEGKRWACVLCRVLDWLDKNHCSDSAGV